MSTSMFVRRAVAAVAGGAVVAGGLMAVAPAPAAHAATPTPNPEASAAAAWLTGELDASGRFTVGFDPTGLTIDLGQSLLATGAEADKLDLVIDGVEGVLSAYVGPEASPNRARLAKAADFFQATGAELSNVAGIDLLGRLETAVDDTSGDIGPADDDYRIYGQIPAVKVLAQAGSPDAPAATDRLLGWQCPDGGWGSIAGGCTSFIDATAYAIAALAPQRANPEVAAAINAGASWLRGQRQADGGWGSWGVNTGGSTSEANGSALVGLALGAIGDLTSAAQAATWVAEHQVVNLPSCGLDPVPGEAGALAYDDDTLRLATPGGIPTDDRGIWVGAGAQALAVLKYLPAAKPSLSGFVDAGTTATVPLQGARSGQQVCVNGLGAPQVVTAPAAATFAVPAGTADHAVTLTYLGGTTAGTLKALDAKKLKVKVKAKVKAKKKATVKVKGLAAGESVAVKIGKKTATGTANAKGVAKVKVKVTKKGRVKVKVVGQFPDRKGKATTRVV